METLEELRQRVQDNMSKSIICLAVLFIMDMAANAALFLYFNLGQEVSLVLAGTSLVFVFLVFIVVAMKFKLSYTYFLARFPSLTKTLYHEAIKRLPKQDPNLVRKAKAETAKQLNDYLNEYGLRALVRSGRKGLLLFDSEKDSTDRKDRERHEDGTPDVSGIGQSAKPIAVEWPVRPAVSTMDGAQTQAEAQKSVFERMMPPLVVVLVVVLLAYLGSVNTYALLIEGVFTVIGIAVYISRHTTGRKAQSSLVASTPAVTFPTHGKSTGKKKSIPMPAIIAFVIFVAMAVLILPGFFQQAGNSGSGSSNGWNIGDLAAKIFASKDSPQQDRETQEPTLEPTPISIQPNAVENTLNQQLQNVAPGMGEIKSVMDTSVQWGQNLIENAERTKGDSPIKLDVKQMIQGNKDNKGYEAALEVVRSWFNKGVQTKDGWIEGSWHQRLTELANQEKISREQMNFLDTMGTLNSNIFEARFACIQKLVWPEDVKVFDWEPAQACEKDLNGQIDLLNELVSGSKKTKKDLLPGIEKLPEIPHVDVVSVLKEAAERGKRTVTATPSYNGNPQDSRNNAPQRPDFQATLNAITTQQAEKYPTAKPTKTKVPKTPTPEPTATQELLLFCRPGGSNVNFINPTIDTYSYVFQQNGIERIKWRNCGGQGLVRVDVEYSIGTFEWFWITWEDAIRKQLPEDVWYRPVSDGGSHWVVWTPLPEDPVYTATTAPTPYPTIESYPDWCQPDQDIVTGVDAWDYIHSASIMSGISSAIFRQCLSTEYLGTYRVDFYYTTGGHGWAYTMQDPSNPNTMNVFNQYNKQMNTLAQGESFVPILVPGCDSYTRECYGARVNK